MAAHAVTRHERPGNFVVSLVADEQNCIASLSVLDRFQMDLRDQRAGGVDRPQIALMCDLADLRRHAMSGKEERGAEGYVGQVVDERHAAFAEMLDDKLVVDDLVVDIDRRLERRQCEIERLDRHVDARAETPRTGYENLHAPIVAGTLRVP